MTGIIASIRATLEPDERPRDRSADDPVESAAPASTLSVTESAAADLSVATCDVPDRPSDTYHELGMSPAALLAELVRASGGRAWQGDLVTATDWSKSTVSRYLSEMEADGRIARVSVGRENVVGLSDVLGEAPERTRRDEGV